MKLVDRLRAMNNAPARDQLLREYRALVHKAHDAGGDLSAADARRLMEVAEGLSVSIGDIEGDLDALGRAAEYRSRGSRVVELEAEHVRAIDTYSRTRDEYNRRWDELAGERDAIANRLLRAGEPLDGNEAYAAAIAAFRAHLDDNGRSELSKNQREANRLKAELDKSRAALRRLDELVAQHPRVLSPADTLPPSAPSPEPQPKASAEPKSNPAKP